MIHFDANFIVASVVKGSDENRLAETWIQSGVRLGVSAVAWSEFLCGPVTLLQITAAAGTLGKAKPFLAEDATEAARLFNSTGRRSRSLADCQIAAIALRLGASIATDNVSDFIRFEAFGLKLLRIR